VCNIVVVHEQKTLLSRVRVLDADDEEQTNLEDLLQKLFYFLEIVKGRISIFTQQWRDNEVPGINIWDREHVNAWDDVIRWIILERGQREMLQDSKLVLPLPVVICRNQHLDHNLEVIFDSGRVENTNGLK
jgi:hypothetical protein